MSLLNYTKITDAADQRVVLTTIKNFAKSQGWRYRYLANTDWSSGGGLLTSDPAVEGDLVMSETSGGYGFTAGGSGSRDFLIVKSLGYGGQHLMYMFFTSKDSDPWGGTDSNNSWIEFSSRKSNNPNIDYSDIQPPTDSSNCDRSNQDGRSRFSVKPYTIPELWVFGNDRQIIVVVNIDNVMVNIMHVGTVELFDTTETYGNYAGNSSNNYYKWSEYSTYYSWWEAMWNRLDYYILQDNDWTNVNVSRGLSLSFNYNDVQSSYVKFARYTKMIHRNNYSGKRVMMKPIVYNLDSGYWRPLGTLPIYHIEFIGLTIGQEIVYGQDKYLIFPNINKTRKYGFAIKGNLITI